MEHAMFISEIPVRCSSSITQGEKSIRWINNLTSRTTARDVLKSILPSNVDTNKFGLYICLGRSKELLADSSRIYKAVSSVHQNKYARRLLFEIRSKKVVKRVRFADEIVVQTIVHGKCLNDNRLTSDLIETISRPSTDCSKENETHRKKHRSSLKIPKRSLLRQMTGNISPSSSESGISSNLSNDDADDEQRYFETLV